MMRRLLREIGPDYCLWGVFLVSFISLDLVCVNRILLTSFDGAVCETVSERVV